MSQVMFGGIYPADVVEAVGAATYARGVAYFQQGAVCRAWWDDAQSALAGTVRGTAGEPYTTIAFFSLIDDLPPQFEHGRCSCPMAVNCKHVVALILAGGQAAPEPAQERKRPEPPSWERSLESLLEPGPAGAPGQTRRTPIAIELTLAPATRPGQARVPAARRTADQPPPASLLPMKLQARLVQRGKNGGWIAGSLSWSSLDSLQFQGQHVAEHVRLLQEMFAVYHSRTSRWATYSSYSADKSIDLSTFESSQLWPMLDEAQAAGLRLIYGGKLGVTEHYRSGELCLDVTRGESAGSLVVAPAVRIDGMSETVLPLSFIGTEGHGLVYVSVAEADHGSGYATWRFGLARLAKPVPAQLQRMALDGQRLQIPEAELTRFRDEYYPRLRHTATVVSSDESFTPPQISDPTLVLSASYGAGHDVDVSWAWEYQIGDSSVRAPLGPDQAGGYRDLEAERLLLAGVDLPFSRHGLLRAVPVWGEAPGAEPDLAASVRLGGMDTMLFTTELLPLAGDQPGVRVEVAGDPADYRAADDSLQIGVSANEVTGDQDWFDLGLTIHVDGHLIQFADVFLALSCGETHLLLEDGAYFSLQKPELQALARLIFEARELQDAPPGELRISRFQAGLWDELTDIAEVSYQSRAWEQQVQGLLSADAIGQEEPPAMLSAVLRPYQLTGFQWLAFLWKYRLGGILADDMGLGKTVQTLALIGHAREADPALPPFLIVAPTSVAPNWLAESARFTPGLKVVQVAETAARRGQDLAEIIAGADVVVTSYALLRIDFDRYAEIGWSGLILDEAQFAKNHRSKIYQCARRLPAPFKLAITGTPMENNLMELWSLLSITAPGLFPDPTRFRDFYARPIERGGQADLLGQLRRRMKPLIKRRTKELVAAELPAKQEQVLEVELHPRHRKIYETQLQRERQKVLGLIHDLNANRFTILRSLTLLRQLSLHAGLVGDEHAEVPSAKIDALLLQLRDVTEGGHRALVFSQFTSFLRMVAGRLDTAGVPYCYLDGKTRDRAAAVQEFREGAAPVFLISLKAGGFGLNLTEADYCFLLDPWWNPATEAQAVDRTHRIGQTRNVMVYRLIAAGTIEEKVMALKERKAELFSSVMESGNAFGATLDADDIRGLFT